MAGNDKFIVRTKKTYGENTVVSCRMPVELDKIGGKTGRTRNELILKCVKFALDKLEIVEEWSGMAVAVPDFFVNSV